MSETVLIVEDNTVVEVVDGDTTTVEIVERVTETIEIVEAGPQGPIGPAGVCDGPAFTHTQTSAQSSWTVVHQLGRKPMVDVQVSDEQVIARVTFPSANAALVEFNSPATGVALCF